MARQLSSKKPKRLGYTVGRLLGYMGHYKLLFFAVALLVTVSAVANLAGTYMIRPVVNSLDGGTWQEFVSGVVLTACVYGVGVLCALGYTQCMVSVAQKALYDIRRDLFAHLQDLPLVWFDGRNRGDVMSYFTNDVDTIADALNNSFAMVIQSFIQMTGTLIMLFVLNWKLSLIVAVCYAAMFLYIRYSGRRSKAYYNKQQACLGELDGYIEEMVNGQKVVKVFNHEDASIEAFVAKNRALQKAGTGAQSYAATMIPAVVSISYVNYAIVAVLGGIMALRGTMDAGSLASYLVFVRQAAAPINQFTQQSNFLLAALAGAERVFEVMDEKPETDEGGTVLVNVEAGADGALRETEHKTGRWAWRAPDGTLTPLRGDVRFESVDFGYEPGHPVLHGISLYAKPGQKIAFVGSTGAGKTTITNLINRFYDVQGGRVVYDGIDVRYIKKESLRRSLGMVLQDTHLFTGTIADNIRFGKLDATRQEYLLTRMRQKQTIVTACDSSLFHKTEGELFRMEGGVLDILWSLVTALIGAYLLASGFEGFFFRWSLKWFERPLMILGAVMLIVPGMVTDLVGIAIIVVEFVTEFMFKRSEKFVPVTVSQSTT